MFFTLAVSAATPEACAALTDRALVVDPAAMPIPGPATVGWRSPDGRTALLHWGGRPDGGGPAGAGGPDRARGPAGAGESDRARVAGGSAGAGVGGAAAGAEASGRHGADAGAHAGANVGATSHAGTIWTGSAPGGSGRAPVYARTSITRVDPVYVAEVADSVIIADRATWAAWTASRLDAHDPLHVIALLNPGFPLGVATPFASVSALTSATTLHVLNGVLTRLPTPVGGQSPRPELTTGGSARWASEAAGASRAGAVPRADWASGHPGGDATAGAGEMSAPGSSARSGRAFGTDGILEGFATGATNRVSGADWALETGCTRGAGGVSARSGGTATFSGRGAVGGLSGGARAVAEALVASVADLATADQPVELSLTGGKDSRLVAAALVAAGVPVIGRTHGFADHPDVMVAAEIARRLGIEHLVRTPAAPGQQVEVLGRIRATVLVADGMLSAFENVGRPDPASSTVITAGGHGGELLRGGYAETAGRPSGEGGGVRAAFAPARRAARSAEMLRRLTVKHLGLIRRGPAAGYVASISPWSIALARGPLQALDDFYLVNRAGRWSAAARQAYLLRERLVQPLFDDPVVLAARAVPLSDRISGALSAAVLAELCPALVDVPLAGKPASGAAPFDWRRQYGDAIASLLRDYTIDHGAVGGLFDVVNRTAVEKLLTSPHPDRPTVWALATLACLLSGDYRNARDASPTLPVV